MRFVEQAIQRFDDIRRKLRNDSWSGMTADLNSEIGEQDHLELLKTAKIGIRMVDSLVNEDEADVMEDLLLDGGRVELIIGPTQDQALIDRLITRGALVAQLDYDFESPFTIVDGKSLRKTSPYIVNSDSPQIQQIWLHLPKSVVPNIIPKFDQDFEDLWADAIATPEADD